MSALEIDNKTPLQVGQNPPRAVKDFNSVDARSAQRQTEQGARAADSRADLSRRRRFMGQFVISAGSLLAASTPQAQEHAIRPVVQTIEDTAVAAKDRIEDKVWGPDTESDYNPIGAGTSQEPVVLEQNKSA